MQRHFASHQLADDEDIFAAGYVTSMFAVQLVEFLEYKFDIEIASEDLYLDNFRTIVAMCALVARKRS